MVEPMEMMKSHRELVALGAAIATAAAALLAWWLAKWEDIPAVEKEPVTP